MCATCGCSGDGHLSDTGHGHEHTLVLEQRVLARNDEPAEENRAWRPGGGSSR